MILSSLLKDHRTGTKPRSIGSDFSSSVRMPVSMKPALVLRGHRGCINTCSFNPSGEFQLTGCDDGTVYMWDIGHRNPTPKLMIGPHHTNVFTTNFLSRNKFVSGANDAVVCVTEIAEGRAYATKYTDHHIRKVHSSFVIDENTFATCSMDRTVRLFDIRQHYKDQPQPEELKMLTSEDTNYNGMQKLHDDMIRYKLQSQSEGGGSYLPRTKPVNDETLLLDFRKDIGSRLFQMDVHPIDRKQFLTTTDDGSVSIFDMRALSSYKPNEVPKVGFNLNYHYGHHVEVTGATFNKTGDRIAATVIGGKIHVLDTALSTEITSIDPPEQLRLNDFIDRTGQLDITALTEAFVRNRRREQNMPDPDNGILHSLSGHVSRTTIKTCNWMDKYVVTGSDQGSIVFYDVDKEKVIYASTQHRSNVNIVTVHQEKNLLATSGVDDFSILWEPQLISKYSPDHVERETSEALEFESIEQARCNVM